VIQKRREIVKRQAVFLDHTNTDRLMKQRHQLCRKIRGSVSPVAPVIVDPVFFWVFSLDAAAKGLAERR